MITLLNKISTYLRMIKFSHSIFALPFAFTAAILAANGLPSLRQGLWIAVAMVGARSAAMGLNRVVDRKIDALNPRTSSRELPAGTISVTDARVFVAVSTVVFFVAAYMLNPLCFKLAPLAIGIIFFYSYTKRFTWVCHLVLGVAIALAPLGAWIAIKGNFSYQILPLVAAVIFWLAGFDTIYGLQDTDFDRSHGLYSIPQRFGVRAALSIARGFHVLAWMLLVLTGGVFGLGIVYYAGMVGVALFFWYEHSIISKDDLTRINVAFFNANGYISMTVFVFVLMEKSL
ncbi:MAG: UbiA-like polyprenyltransferase [Candidatus Magnetobacterium sp. LHC-1]|uniref:UbiA family prenyltransferase n=1 Tax=Candidatus Magnetobacterium casense TaxID=1455061 RepID=A0ABS6RYG5_9BACT|nr:UbiA-like polyprenyltransferase [Candidatus Magnetobacterium casensis]MBV6341621.1 UbiA family prenyltransferase [Candidatus Magnetobacterium casensis]